MLNNMLGILLRFRRKKIVLSADIKDFFYRIQLNPIDRPATRFLWWANESMQEEIILEGACHLFGLASSPCVSNIVLQYHAMKNREKIDVDTFLALLLQFYVDDFLHSVDNINDARRIKKQLTEFLADAGFELLKWRSNYPELNDTNDSLSSPQANDRETQMTEEKREVNRSPAIQTRAFAARLSTAATSLEGAHNPNRRPAARLSTAARTST